MNAYSVSHVTRSIILTRDFAKKASILGTEEYKIFLNLRRDNPEYEVIQRTIAKSQIVFVSKTLLSCHSFHKVT